MVDWRVARRIAGGVAGDPGLPSLDGDLAELCVDGERRVVAYTGLTPAAPLPPPEAVDRPGWLDANLSSMRGVLDPVVERLGRPASGRPSAVTEALKAAGGFLMAAEVGGLVGLMAQRVLGQYEVSPVDPTGPARLLFVAPNLREAAGRLHVEEASLLRWVALHEVTHAVQFASVPWLRPHVAGMLQELLDALDVRVKVDLRALGRLVSPEEMRELAGRVREGGLMTAVLGPERRALLDRIQATMALIEGHAEHVMDAAGAEALPDLGELRAALTRRRRERPPLLRVLERLLGLEMKMRQYEVGKRFCDAVVEREGVAALNRAWTGADRLPTWAELEDPASWLARVT
jgi:coenzyme F420 biosynthesis associated uncharacterized protein